MNTIFYGEPYDVRQIEANILINKIVDCLSDGENLRQDAMDENFRDNFLENCNLNFNSEEMWEEKQYYIEIKDLDITKGNVNLKNYIKKLLLCVLKGIFIFWMKIIKAL